MVNGIPDLDQNSTSVILEWKESLVRCGITVVKFFRTPGFGEHKGKQKRSSRDGEGGVHSL